ncbi:MAG: hypothetical protein ABIJ97_09140 [Bacteroidota bacterium]
MKIHAIKILLLLFVFSDIYSQSTDLKSDSLLNKAINIFIDCTNCDMEFIKKEIQIVNYVREQKEADVFIMVTSQTTGSNGTEFTFTFIGQKRFSGVNDTLVFNSNPDDSYDDIRRGKLNILKLGLIRYISKTPQANLLSINYLVNEDNDELIDKWNNWVFEINGNMYMNGEESSNNYSLYSYASINQIKEEHKIMIGLYSNLSQNNYKIEDETITSNYQSQSASFLYVKSLTDHWSAGISNSLWSSLYSNIDFNFTAYPTVEYNLFKYSESTRRQLCFQYKTGYVYNNYIDTTIYGMTEENLLKESLSIAFTINDKWGSISTSLSGSHYFHDIDINNINLWCNIRIRIVKGLSFNVYAYASLIHDQINLQKEGATSEEILLQQRLLATQYSYYCSTGLTYTFGSIYNNIVNPRFGN